MDDSSRRSGTDYVMDLRPYIGTRLVHVPGVRVIIERFDGHVLLQLRSDFGIWGLPAGAVDVGETVEDCLAREVKEETGLDIENGEWFGFASAPESETVTYPNGDRIRCFSILFRVTTWSGELDTSDPESEALAFFAVDELPDLLPHHRRTIEAFVRFRQTGTAQFI